MYLFPVYLSAFSNLSVYLSLFSVCMFLSLSQCLYLFSISISFNIQHSVSPFHTKISRKKVLLFCLSVFLFADSYTLTSFHFCILFILFNFFIFCLSIGRLRWLKGLFCQSEKPLVKWEKRERQTIHRRNTSTNEQEVGKHNIQQLENKKQKMKEQVTLLYKCF